VGLTLDIQADYLVKLGKCNIMGVPFVTFWGVGFTLDIQADYLVKLGKVKS
jgi:hypothetical protein